MFLPLTINPRDFKLKSVNKRHVSSKREAIRLILKQSKKNIYNFI